MASIQWQFMFFGFSVTLLSANHVNELVLNPNPSQVGEQLFQCVVISTSGYRYTQETPFTVKGIMTIVSGFICNVHENLICMYMAYYFGLTELEHSVGITSSSTTQVKAGGVVVLTCESVSDRLPHLTWVGPDGPVTSGNGITVLYKNINETASQSTLAFHPLRTSHAGLYTCTSNVESGFSVKEESHSVSVQSKY